MDPVKQSTEMIQDAKLTSFMGTVTGNAAHQKLARSILFKLDTRILPILALLFLCSFLDRTNVGNAKILGLEHDLNITSHQYDIGLSVFYLTYICSELPSNLILKKASPRVWLPLLTMVWGTITMCLGFVRNFAGFVAVRAILGAAEGGLLPGMVLYLSSFYKRGDLALRIGLFYTAASLSGAFGGLLARGLAEIGPRGGLEGWRWILVIEGLLTVVCGGLSYIGLPNSIETATFLTPEERSLAREEIRLDNPSALQVSPSVDDIETLRWSEVRRGLLDPQMWFSAAAYFAILSGLYSFGLFVLLVAFISDCLHLRGTIMLFTLPIAIVGYGAIANLQSAKVKYGMTFLMATGMYSSVPCILVWNSNNSAGHYKRATTSAMQLTIANCGGFLATFNYPNKDRPQYNRGHTIILGLLVFAWFMVSLNVLYCAKVNRDKKKGKYARYVGYNDDRDPAFKLML
ncbi:major facilitator superfamily domain-containing protein [Aspergillus alliaceus]|uniref:Major facilitator superfamily domain-containing protein n=1 Tax=Petromyces alliaceus TaxID=209559 RepID=A0A5N7C0J5_PETAA|nr:major facilitator superfamily domain-containing protein [Aspergillus alliaceus]